jgi:hypothetical protein
MLEKRMRFYSMKDYVSARAPCEDKGVILDHGFSPLFFLSSLFQIFNMDLFNPVKDQNDYGARGKKNVSQLVAI